MAVQPERGTSEPSRAWHDRAQRLIPGGAHTYSKDDAHFPPNAPEFVLMGQGAHVQGSDGERYLDWGMGLRSVILGHASPPVLEAVRSALDIGANHTRPTLLEGRLAERMVSLIPCAEMVKFGKNGSDATTAAVRLARAYTGRQAVVVVGDGFHASDDWWLSTQPRSKGTIEQGTVVVPYNTVPSLEGVAAVVMEPMAFAYPKPGYLQLIRELCTRTGTVLIFDEVITGFRFGLSGGQGYFGVTPDLACFGKAMANGFSVSALVGRRELMQAPGVHLLSSTHGGETHALAASLATIETLERERVSAYLLWIGSRLQAGLTEIGYDVRGYPSSPTVAFPDEAARLRFIEGMCAHGILAPYWAPSFSHTEADVDRTLEAAAKCASRS